MEATLIYNPNARQTDEHTVDDMLSVLRANGFFPVYKATETEDDLDEALRDVEGLVVAAGGDGTMRAVAMRLVGTDAAVALLPLGTANNIGNTLGIKGEPIDILERLANPRKVKFDVGQVTAPWGRTYFLEGMGYGFFADTLAAYDPEKGKSVFRGISTFTKTLANYRSYPCRLELDGVDISDDYLMVEVLNTKAVGPRLTLAPDASPGDGVFDIICVRADEQAGFLRYVTGLATNGFDELPSVDHFSGSSLSIQWTGFPIHVDAEVGPHRKFNGDGEDEEEDPLIGSLPEQGAEVKAEVLAGALNLWLPAPKDK